MAWRLARAQTLLITLRQLLQCGFSRSAIAHRVKTGRLFRVFPGVFAVGHHEMTPARLAMAAALACGEVAGVGRRSAAAVWRITEDGWPAIPQVTAARTSWRRGPRGIDLIPSRTLTAAELIVVEGVKVTTLPRTIADNAAFETDRGTRTLVRHAQREHKLGLDALLAYADAHPPTSYRHARIKRALGPYVKASALTDSEREALVMEICAAHGIPLPRTQEWILGYRVDFVWPSLRLILEVDDRWSHDNPFRFVEDRVRDRRLQAAGYVVIRFAVAEVLRSPAGVAQEIRAVIARRAA